ncbi:hypothetical protein NHP190012_14840 [Helicobacter sp. NHP19-012]|uniref:Uncharacterized protein n=2 Tax=Helicobacter TaxID=209 RepID=A0ABN6IAT4_9HELI|nr:hypothetical protein NHP190012_14840 [Helicobacter sp. NHP19-012]
MHHFILNSVKADFYTFKGKHYERLGLKEPKDNEERQLLQIAKRYQNNIRQIEARMQHYLESKLKSYTHLRFDTLKDAEITLNLDFQVFINRHSDLATTHLYYVFRAVFKRFAAYKVKQLLEKIHSKLLMRKIKANHLWLKHACPLSF